MITRRATLLSLASLLAASLAAEAQRERLYRIGYLGLSAGPTSTTRAFREELRARGWIEGPNISIEYRWLASSAEGPAALAQQLLRLGVDIILTAGNKAVEEVRKTTTSVPIVMAWSNDPV